MLKSVALALLSTARSADVADPYAESTFSSLDTVPLLPKTTSVANISSDAAPLTTSTGYAYHKQFSFDYDSTSNDPIEVDVDINDPDSRYYDSDDEPELAVAVKRALGPTLKSDDVVWITRYTGGTTTLPIPSTTITQTVTGTTTAVVTSLQTATTTQFRTEVDTVTDTVSGPTTTALSTAWQTVTVVSGNTVSPVTVTVTEFQPTDKTTETINTDGTNADCSAQNQQAFQLGYVNGADWGYTVGYNDAARGRPFVVPSFATGVYTQTPPAYTPAPQTFQAPPPPPPAAQPSPPPAPYTVSYPSISYSTISYWVPYGGYGYGPGYGPYRGPYELENEDNEEVNVQGDAEAGSEGSARPTARLNVFDTTDAEA